MQATRDVADDFIKKRDYRAALQIYLDILQRDPNDRKTHQGLAQCWYRLKKYDNAVSACTRAIELDPSLAIPHVILAYIHYYHEKDLDKAVAEALKAYELSPELEEVLVCYGALLGAKGRIEEGISILHRALEANPTSIATHYNLAVLYEQKRHNKESLEEWKAVFKYKPTLRHGLMLLIAYERRYSVLFAIVITAALFGSMFVKSKILLLLPCTMVIQIWLNAFQLIKRGRWKNALFDLVSSTLLALIIYAFYVALTPG